MLSVGVYEAKARLSQLIERVTQGEEVLVTRRGRPVARLVLPELGPDRKAVSEWAAELRRFRRGVDRGARTGTTLEELIAAGRR